MENNSQLHNTPTSVYYLPAEHNILLVPLCYEKQFMHSCLANKHIFMFCSFVNTSYFSPTFSVNGITSSVLRFSCNRVLFPATSTAEQRNTCPLILSCSCGPYKRPLALLSVAIRPQNSYLIIYLLKFLSEVKFTLIVQNTKRPF